jgi:gamma-butyrobetaine dioxygenase
MSISGHLSQSADGQQLHLHYDGKDLELDALWLRERAPDADTLDPQTGQRLIEAADLPLDLAILTATAEGDRLDIRFSDGHQSWFSLTALNEEVTPSDEFAERRLWDSRLSDIPHSAFSAAVNDDGALLELLENLHRFGFVRVDGVPDEAEGMQTLMARIGPLRRTNWGGVADVKSVANAYDLTMTQRGLEPHTDNPYRDPIPGFVWLHCLANAAGGGDNTLVDGFSAAQRLREEDPEAFACLTRVTPGFCYHDETTRLESEGPLIELDGQDHLMRVRFSNRTERVSARPGAELRRYYAARQAFYRLITSEDLTLNIKLEAGQMLIMDNYRLLHGRTSFHLENGVRHMRQGYVDQDSTASRRLVLRDQLSTSQGTTA